MCNVYVCVEMRERKGIGIWMLDEATGQLDPIMFMSVLLI